MLAFITWSVNPEIIPWDHFSPRWYGLLFASGFYLGYLYIQRVFKNEGVKLELLDKLLWYMVLSTIIGARLGHVFFYDWESYSDDLISILYIWEGGLASHGAAIGILVGLFLFMRFSGINKTYLWVVDRIVIVVALAGCMIRLGNLMNSEIIGKETDMPWAFIFTRLHDNIPRHPTQIYEALCYLISFGILHLIYKRYKAKTPDGLLFGTFLILVFSARFLIEFYKEVQVDFEKELPLDMGQILSIPFILAGIGLIIYSKLAKAKQQNIDQQIDMPSASQ